MPTPRLFGSTSKSSSRQLEIVLDSPFVVLYGDAQQAEPGKLSGRIVLDAQESIDVSNIKVELTGRFKTQWWTNTITPQKVQEKKDHYYDSIVVTPTTASSGSAHKIKGHHEWPFSFDIPGCIMESVEGLPSSYVVYEIGAMIERSGFAAKNVHAPKRHVRIVRTLARTTPDDLTYDQVNEDIWPSKISYKISVPRKNHIFGTSVTADFQLTPLRKGLTIGKIRMEVVEKQILRNVEKGYVNLSERIVMVHEQEMPEGCERIQTESDANNPMDEGFAFSTTMQLAKSLRSCRVAADTEPIKLEHRLKLYVDLHNPEGHTSQLLVKNLFFLYISPHYAPDENNVVPEAPANHEILAQAIIASQPTQAPPTYGDHHFDRPVDAAIEAALSQPGSPRNSVLEHLYDGIDPEGFLTPAAQTGSGTNTPFYAHSQSNSDEDVVSIDAVAQVASHGGPSSIDLHSRLARVQDHGSSHWARQQGHGNSHHVSQPTSGGATPFVDAASGRRPLSGTDHDMSAVNPYFPPINRSPGRISTTNSASHSRRPSAEQAASGSPLGSIYMEDYDMDALSRLPSYATALRTPVRTPTTQVPPTYEVAISGPPSPADETVPRSASVSSVDSTSRSSSVSSAVALPRVLPLRMRTGGGQRSGSLSSSGSELSEMTARNTLINASALH